METETQLIPAKRTRRRDQRVRRFRRQVLTVAPHLDDPKFGALLASFARLSILSHDCYEFLREKGLVGENGELRSSVETVNRLIGGQLKLATAMGLSPAALGKIRNEKPIDLAAAMSDEAR